MSKQPNPELYALLVRVAGNYLRHVVNGDEARIGGVILWVDFLEQAEIDKKEYLRQLASLRGRWTPQQHPLLGLDVIAVRWYGEDAEVIFRKADRPEDYPEIRIELLWAGRGWLVKSDSLFGKDKLIAQWESQPTIFKSGYLQRPTN